MKMHQLLDTFFQNELGEQSSVILIVIRINRFESSKSIYVYKKNNCTTNQQYYGCKPFLKDYAPMTKEQDFVADSWQREIRVEIQFYDTVLMVLKPLPYTHEKIQTLLYVPG